MIKFDELKETIIPNFYNGEKQINARMHIDDLNKIMLARLIPNASIGYHTHATSSEIIFFLSGNGEMILDGVKEKVTKGDCHYCKKGSSHSMVNTGDEDLVFYAVVTNQ